MCGRHSSHPSHLSCPALALLRSATYLKRLPDSVDLVVVEWALAASRDDIAKDLDAALRRLMSRWDPPPAFLLVHFFFWCRGNLWCRDYKVNAVERDGGGV